MAPHDPQNNAPPANAASPQKTAPPENTPSPPKAAPPSKTPPPSQDIENLSAALLSAALASGLNPIRVDDVQQLSGGASKENWAFTLHLQGGEARKLVLRRQPPGGRKSSQGLPSVSAEADLVRLAERADIPVPAVAFELPPGSPAGDGYAMARVEGETLGGRVLKLPELAEARGVLARQCGDILARLHNCAEAQLRNLKSSGLREESAAQALAALEQRYRDTATARPIFDFALNWLHRNLPEQNNKVLLHGDFRNGNLVVGPEGIRAVLDWELAFIGPALYDLAWLSVPSWRFQNPQLPVGGFGTREELIAAYEAASKTAIESVGEAAGEAAAAEAADGAPVTVDRKALHAWEVFQILNWGVMCAGVAKACTEGQGSLEAMVIARRCSETEFDLMRMLAPDHPGWEEGRERVQKHMQREREQGEHEQREIDQGDQEQSELGRGGREQGQHQQDEHQQGGSENVAAPPARKSLSSVPEAAFIIAAVRKALTTGLGKGFPQKIAANALGIATRELFESHNAAEECAERLRGLLLPITASAPDLNGTLKDQTETLSRAIGDGQFADHTPQADQLIDHLIRTSIDRLEIDQPRYPAFLQWISNKA